VFLYAFDLIELNGDDLRRDPLDVRKATLASVLRRAAPGLRPNEHIEDDGPTVFAHACELGCEGIVSKRRSSRYSSRRSPQHWLHLTYGRNPMKRILFIAMIAALAISPSMAQETCASKAFSQTS
jgi:hypothetical protein